MGKIPFHWSSRRRIGLVILTQIIFTQQTVYADAAAAAKILIIENRVGIGARLTAMITTRLTGNCGFDYIRLLRHPDSPRARSGASAAKEDRYSLIICHDLVNEIVTSIMIIPPAAYA